MNSPFSPSPGTFSPPYPADQIIPWYLGTILEVLGQSPTSAESLMLYLLSPEQVCCGFFIFPGRQGMK